MCFTFVSSVINLFYLKQLILFKKMIISSFFSFLSERPDQNPSSPSSGYFSIRRLRFYPSRISCRPCENLIKPFSLSSVAAAAVSASLIVPDKFFHVTYHWIFLWVTDKKVQLNTDLLKPRTHIFTRKWGSWLKVNEIVSEIKCGKFN